jgi:hypothetical protein
MTDHYTHFDTREFTEVRNVQTELLAIADNSVKKPEKEKATQNKISQVKKTATKKKAIA